MNQFNYQLEPGKKRSKQDKLINQEKPVISIITPVYNSAEYLEQTANCILNQTFPYWEWLIVDDGSTDERCLERIEKVAKMDSRIKVFHKENGGPADSRDFGAKQSQEGVKYLFFLDEDDLIINTYLECAYWTLETNQEASWTYTDFVNFDEEEFLWRKWFTTQTEKKENILAITGMIRKEDFFAVNGYELREKAVYEDWNFWLKLLAKEKYPVRMSFLGFWYRKKKTENSELGRARNNKERAMEIIQNTAKTITKEVEAIQYPREKYNWDLLEEKPQTLLVPKYEDNGKIKILMIFPWMTMGGADKFNLDLIRGLDKNKFEVIIITTNPHENEWRQQFEEEVKAIYDLTTFLDTKYWASFVQNIIETNNIDIILNTNSVFGYNILPYLKAKYSNIPILDYVHMEEWYNRNGGYSRDSAVFQEVIDKTLVCNKNSEKILVEHFHKPQQEVETVYIGVDAEKFNPDKYNKEEILKKYQLPTNKKIVSFIARIDYQKRPFLFMKIMRELLKTRQDVAIVVAGDGPLLDKIKAKAKKYNIQNNMYFIGAVGSTEEVYKISDVTLNCSIKEGLALTSYESLAMGVPVVSADIGGQKELIHDKVGVIVPCLQKETEIMDFEYKKEEIQSYVVALNEVLEHLEAYKKEARNTILQGFTIEHMIKRMSEILEETKQNPNKEKIQNGEALKQNIHLCKEMVSKQLMVQKGEYEWLCYNFNTKFFGNISVDNGYKYSMLKSKLWANPIWRGFVKLLKKTGIMKLIKKSNLDGKVKEVAKKIV